jgi:hypothetical protein
MNSIANAVLAFLAMLGVLGCAHATQANSSKPAVCGSGWQEEFEFSKLVVKAYPDQHGDYIRPAKCPERTFAADFSESGLYTDQYAKLLEQMRFNASHGTSPVHMVISGRLSLRTVAGEERAYLRVTNIHKYDTGK